MSEPIRVLVVDDSAFNRRNITEILERSDDINVIGKASDGEEALRMALQSKPDVITLDLEMPRMDGFTFLRILMSKQPTAVIVISSYSQKENVFKALELGAIDFVAKPGRQFLPDEAICREITDKVRLVRFLKPLGPAKAPTRALDTPQSVEAGAPLRSASLRHVVAIASSTGGPTALVDLFSRLPERFPGAILVAQHMPERFTHTFAERLDKRGPLRVTEAIDGEPVLARHGYVCPGGRCMELLGGGVSGEFRLRVAAPSPTDRHAPSADRLLSSVAERAGSRAVGVILTGMGDDGTVGARAISAAGGTVIAESAETAVVYGMPGAAVRSGVVSESLPLAAIGEFLALLG
jgi:two-component system chemotaxis response regulator CheB